LDLPGVNGSHKKVAEKISKMMKTNYFGGRVLEEHHTVNVVIRIILLCPKGTYLSKRRISQTNSNFGYFAVATVHISSSSGFTTG